MPAGDLHLAFLADKEVVKENAQWRHSGAKDKIDTQTRKDPGASFIMDSGGPVLSAWVAGERSRVLGQELSEEAERMHADPARKPEDGE